MALEKIASDVIDEGGDKTILMISSQTGFPPAKERKEKLVYSFYDATMAKKNLQGTGMEIKICGPGCAKCDQTYKLVSEVVKKLDKEATISKVTDFQEIAKLGVFSTPALVIDGEVKCVGKVPEEKELISWLG